MLIEHVARYVELHRRLGYKYVDQERTLLNYARFASSEGDRWTRSDRIVEWCRQAASVDRARRKLGVVRDFAEFLHAEDERHEVPPQHAFGRMTNARPSPYLLTREQVRQVMKAALLTRPAGTLTPPYLALPVWTDGGNRSPCLGGIGAPSRRYNRRWPDCPGFEVRKEPSPAAT